MYHMYGVQSTVWYDTDTYDMYSYVPQYTVAVICPIINIQNPDEQSVLIDRFMAHAGLLCIACILRLSRDRIYSPLLCCDTTLVRNIVNLRV